MAFIPMGVKDILAQESAKKDSIINGLGSLYKSFGYRKIETPTFEYYDTFTEIKNTVNKNKTLKMIDSDGKILVLRPDITTPIIRSVESNYKNEPYVKFYYDMSVFRISTNDDKKETAQAGIEYFVPQSNFTDAEVIALAIKSMLVSGIEEFQIDIGQTEYLEGLLEGLKEQDVKDIKRFIANKNIIGLREVLERVEVYGQQKQAILDLPYLYGGIEEILDKIVILNSTTNKAFNNIRGTYEILKKYGFEKYISFDLGMVQSLKYYDGIVFKGYINNFGKPILSGGRYEKGCGFGINVDALVENVELDSEPTTDYIVVGEDIDLVIQKSEELRQQGFVVESMLKGEINLKGKNIIEV